MQNGYRRRGGFSCAIFGTIAYMLYRTLGSTGITVSVVGLGTWQFGGEWGKEYRSQEVDTILGTAKDEGINLIDSAECYGDHRSEELIGQRIRRERDSWIVATKFGHHFHGHMDRTREWDANGVIRQVDASLNALQTDYIDILQYHSPTDEEYGDEMLQEALLELQRSGKVRFLGLSVSRNDNLGQVERMPSKGCEVLQIVYNRLDRGAEAAVFPAARRMDLGVFARVPLASGFLSVKYSADSVFPPDDWRSGWDNAKRTTILNELAGIAESEIPAGVPMAQWAIAWVLKAPAVTAVIPGCRDAGQVKSNAGAIGWSDAPETHPQHVT